MNKYFAVIKSEDVEKYLSDEEQLDLVQSLINIDIGRLRDGKAGAVENKYAIINLDETYAERVTAIMRAHGHDIND